MRGNKSLFGEKMSYMHRFQAEKMNKLGKIEQELLELYPDKEDEIKGDFGYLARELAYLNEYKLYDYERTVLVLMDKYDKKRKEIYDLMPKDEELDKLLNLDFSDEEEEVH